MFSKAARWNRNRGEKENEAAICLFKLFYGVLRIFNKNEE